MKNKIIHFKHSSLFFMLMFSTNSSYAHSGHHHETGFFNVLFHGIEQISPYAIIATVILLIALSVWRKQRASQ